MVPCGRWPHAPRRRPANRPAAVGLLRAPVLLAVSVSATGATAQAVPPEGGWTGLAVPPPPAATDPFSDFVQAAPPPAPATEGILQVSLGDFRLVNGDLRAFSLGIFDDDEHATMRRINGGRMCVGSSGLQPGGYALRGPISVSQCADMAREQSHVVGFRWGRRSFDEDMYRHYVEDPSDPGAFPPDSRVSLSGLFGGAADFTCLIYMADEEGKRPKFKRTVLNERFLPQFVHAKENEKALGTEGNEHSVVLGPPRKVISDGGSKVCNQRWGMADFFLVEVTELWFCYQLASLKPACADAIRHEYQQAGAVVAGALVVLAYLGYVMRGQGHFAYPLSIMVRFIVNMELGMVVVMSLLALDIDSLDAKYRLLGFVLVVVSSNLVLLPYFCFQYPDGSPTAIGMFYLLALAFSPCVFAEWMSYFPRFPLLVAHKPMVLGAAAFLVDVLKLCFLRQQDAVPIGAKGLPTMTNRGAYFPMRQQAETSAPA